MTSYSPLYIRVAPRRMLTIKEAADYCGLKARRFPIDCGVTPVAMPSGEQFYDMHDLDNYIDALKKGAPAGDDDIIAKLGKRS